jgi:WhiB family redox-sensing transcriptional regulator
VCARCLVRAECLDYALADRELVGVWGGLSVRERARVRAAKVAAPAA